jgi:hypothetical protein
LLPLSNKLGNTRRRSVQKQRVHKTFVAWTWVGRGRDAGIRVRVMRLRCLWPAARFCSRRIQPELN